jgi:hypothetical protein
MPSEFNPVWPKLAAMMNRSPAIPDNKSKGDRFRSLAVLSPGFVMEGIHLKYKIPEERREAVNGRANETSISRR